MTSHTNLFTPIRLFLALVVAIEHAFVTTAGFGSVRSWQIFGDASVSSLAVDAFFVISGYLICKSMVVGRDLFAFVLARVLRLVPALVALSLVLIFFVGPFVTRLSPQDYFSHPDTYLFFVRAITFVDSHPNLPEAFTQTQFTNDQTGVLWTLRWEALAYVGVAILFWFGQLERRRLLLAGLAGLACVSVAVRTFAPENGNIAAEVGIRFSLAFGLGMAVYLWHEYTAQLSWLIVPVTGFAILSIATPFEEVLRTLALGLIVLSLALRGPQRLARWLKPVPDVSYGLYIWHWPFYLLLIEFNVINTPTQALIVGLPLALVLAVLSWYWIEKPSLKLKPKLESRPYSSIASGVST